MFLHQCNNRIHRPIVYREEADGSVYLFDGAVHNNCLVWVERKKAKEKAEEESKKIKRRKWIKLFSFFNFE